jgi:hypothetical protein
MTIIENAEDRPFDVSRGPVQDDPSQMASKECIVMIFSIFQCIHFAKRCEKSADRHFLVNCLVAALPKDRPSAVSELMSKYFA